MEQVDGYWNKCPYLEQKTITKQTVIKIPTDLYETKILKNAECQSPTDSIADQWACGVICKGNGLISPRETKQHGLVKSMLHEELKNAPWNASLVPSSVSGPLNREETLSAATKYWRVT
ncbi:MAG: hypothetical protein ACFFCZ_24470 [Promethearchaeota archaeon]